MKNPIDSLDECKKIVDKLESFFKTLSEKKEKDEEDATPIYIRAGFIQCENAMWINVKACEFIYVTESLNCYRILFSLDDHHYFLERKFKSKEYAELTLKGIMDSLDYEEE